ncbi:MAG: hypothetical protein A3D24_03965 [Candidatus Blackburnbacteria bacterium RIFCSPHIGHO2_02_FULL_39_13]|uniref:LemA family protein n=1 Tax=Candidatus Blackburnbacteria bacterium RIFCSPLOWO2_01_FULL_40_20 TaxID=1797519 RepID=A0A1G1VCL5_9BACT|nr:MAG: LemA protein [Microgenomates group bacterium GW2011_GWA2_39_19]OGY06957.1 MAG: hypothetical protein A2694_02460 [Candidatus Blackburnbacteria bacterium RIFCSPHIGHO2_01_FULL_40_17]OGY09624.1 MAG: hypothetical protein A3D24_03965 [Candidatus Blackburnbacteria bacterium RIFCSPHIGHO2_02_FULL_39_13]OGY13213.1 MAG: hypothetical protein A3A77_01410 [Candidatus Blackburnbacteria bacterium RIFCSPLOWO2_01_FULL_40_20]OGY15503.1 MAG: hypothetical protein A3I52_00765 [Candidatus Blackburnbacteria ba
MNISLILLIIAGLIAIYVISTYNYFATLAVRIRASIQEIGNQLKRQADLIPNLETSAKAYLKHEKGIFDSLTEARKAVTKAQKTQSLEDVQKAEDLISGVLPKIQVVVESNPEIKGAEVVSQLMNELRDTSDKLMYSRRTFIDLVADYNSSRAQFPSNIIASMFGFGEEKGFGVPSDGSYLEVSSEEAKTPKVSL